MDFVGIHIVIIIFLLQRENVKKKKKKLYLTITIVTKIVQLFLFKFEQHELQLLSTFIHQIYPFIRMDFITVTESVKYYHVFCREYESEYESAS